MKRAVVSSTLAAAMLLVCLLVSTPNASAAPGSLWRSMSIADGWFRSVDFLNRDVGWASAYAGRVAATDDGGATWTLLREVDGDYLTDIASISADVAWVAGYRDEAGQVRSFVLGTVDGGATWAEYDFPLQSYKYSGEITFVDRQYGYVVVGGVLYTTEDGGASWQPLLVSGFVETLCFVDVDHGWVISTGSGSGSPTSTLWRTTDAGKSWAELPIVVPAAGALGKISFVDEANGYASMGSGALTSTNDGGLTWKPAGQIDGGVYLLRAVDATRAWVLGGGGEVYGTDDAGLTWQARSLPQPHPNGSDLAVIGDRAWLVGSVNLRTEKSGYSDMRPPATTHDAPDFANQAVEVHLSATDQGSGVVTTWYRVDDGAWQQGTTLSLDVPAGTVNGAHYVYYASEDAYGNFEPIQQFVVHFDLSPPVVSMAAMLEDQLDHWTNRPCTVYVSARDDWWGSGASRVDVRRDGGDWVSHPPEYQVTLGAPSSHANDGVHVLEGRGVDAVGNVGAAQTHTVGIDTRRPRVVAPYPATARARGVGSLVFKIADTRPCSGLCSVVIVIRTLAGRPVGILEPDVWFRANRLTTLRFECPLRPGKYRFIVRGGDGAGNKAVNVARNYLVVRRARGAAGQAAPGVLELEAPSALGGGSLRLSAPIDL